MPQQTPPPPMMSHRTHIVLAHGGGGQLTDELIAALVLPRLGNGVLNQLADAGVVATNGQRVALTIDGYVVQPPVFPGGDIGRLAVCGTVNDLAVSGAVPVGIALSLILEEGLPQSVLERVLDSIAAAAQEAGVPVITGDTKVVGRGQADGLYITTAGVGVVPAGRELGVERVQPGDAILINGPIADHGLTVMLAREMPEVQSVLRSDAAPLNGLIERVWRVGWAPPDPPTSAGLAKTEEVGGAHPTVVFMRDATRSGLAGVATDLAARTGYHVVLDDTAIAVRPETRHAAEMLGLDPLEVANEGKVVLVVRAEAAEAVLAAMREDRYGKEARVIGRVEAGRDGVCELRTAIGGRRVVQKPYGEQLPRIC